METTKYTDYPIGIIVENPTSEPQKAVIFGAKKFLDEENYGSDSGICVKSIIDWVRYIDILEQSKHHQCHYSHIKFVSFDMDGEVKNNVLDFDVTFNTADESEIISLEKHKYSSEFYETDKILEREITINDTKYLSIIVPANTHLRILFYCKISQKQTEETFGVDSGIPYQVVVENKSNKVQKAVLFGCASNYHKANFGNPAGLDISVPFSDVDYSKLLFQSGVRSFTCNKIRLHSSKRMNIEKNIKVCSSDANGQSCTIPITPSKYELGIQTALRDIPFKVKINESTEISFDVHPNSQIAITLFPESEKRMPRTSKELLPETKKNEK